MISPLALIEGLLLTRLFFFLNPDLHFYSLFFPIATIEECMALER